jgi:hypothetical protein
VISWCGTHFDRELTFCQTVMVYCFDVPETFEILLKGNLVELSIFPC